MTKFQILIGTLFIIFVFDVLFYITGADTSYIFVMDIWLFPFFYYVVFRPEMKDPLKRIGENRIDYYNRIKRTLEEIKLTPEDYKEARTPTRFDRFSARLGARLSRLDDLLEMLQTTKKGDIVRRMVLAVLGFMFGWYAIKNKSWFAGLFCVGFFYESVKSNPKKPS